MIRFVLLLFVVVLIGAGVLSLFSSELAGDLVFFVFWLLVAAVVLKLVLDFFLHFKKEKVDRESSSEVLKEREGKVFYSIKNYSQAVRQRYRRRQ